MTTTVQTWTEHGSNTFNPIDDQGQTGRDTINAADCCTLLISF